MFKYFVSVRVSTDLEDAGKISLDGVLEITDDEQKRLKLAEDMIKNEIWKTTPQEALKTFNLSHLGILEAFFMRAHVNNLSVHLFESDVEFSREDLAIWINSCNFDSIAKQKLLDSRIRRKNDR